MNLDHSKLMADTRLVLGGMVAYDFIRSANGLHWFPSRVDILHTKRAPSYRVFACLHTTSNREIKEHPY